MRGSRPTTRSQQLMAEALQHIPGGVNSPVRSFRAVGGRPLFIARGAGARVFDVDGNAYIDYVLSWGPLILGHAPPRVVEAVKRTAELGTSFGAPTELETELARLIKAAFPSIELVRMVNSGTEATMSAIRLARAFTRRRKVIKFAGCYHGHHDALLVKAGSGATDLGVPDSPGVPGEVTAHTLNLPFNDLDAVAAAFNRFGEDIACVIVEPVAGNMGLVLPRPGFLTGLRELTARHGSLLIFDEVLTGFRVGLGGAQERFGVRPDLTTLGKVIGGGLPVGAYGGRGDVMEMVAPSGPVYQAGTLSGNPLAMAAGIETLRALSEPGAVEALERRTAALAAGLAAAVRAVGAPWPVCQIGSLFGLFFADGPVHDYEGALRCDLARFRAFFLAMLAAGVYLAPSQFESGFVSLAHTDADIDVTVAAARHALEEAARLP